MNKPKRLLVNTAIGAVLSPGRYLAIGLDFLAIVSVLYLLGLATVVFISYLAIKKGKPR